MLALHPTHPAGKDVVCALAYKENRDYGLELVRRGYVVLAPDTITAGERVAEGWDPYETQPWDEANRGWSAMGKMVWDHQRGIDVLQTLDVVRAGGVRAIGHSLGAYNAFFLAAFDERVTACVESCGYSTMAADTAREHWSRTTWFVHFPALRPYVEPGGTLPTPWEFHEVLALLAPRALFQAGGIQDHR